MLKYLLLFVLSFSTCQLFAVDDLTDSQVDDYSGNKPQPPALKDAQIDVNLVTGDKYNFSANEYKVVSRESSRKVQQLINELRRKLRECQGKLASCEEQIAELETKIKAHEKVIADKEAEIAKLAKAYEEKVLPMNRVSIYGGIGSDGLVIEEVEGGNNVAVRQDAPLVGISYDRRVYEDWSLSVILARGVYTDSRGYVGLLGVGYDF